MSRIRPARFVHVDEFDPDQWLAKLHAGTAPGELLVRRVHEPMSPIRGTLGMPA